MDCPFAKPVLEDDPHSPTRCFEDGNNKCSSPDTCPYRIAPRSKQVKKRRAVLEPGEEVAAWSYIRKALGEPKEESAAWSYVQNSTFFHEQIGSMLPSQVELNKAADTVYEETVAACFMAVEDPYVLTALQSPVQMRGAMKPQSTFGVMWDSGASMSITHDIRDFVGKITPAPWIKKLSGLAKGMVIKGVGTVAWTFIDVHGRLRTIYTTAYYVPKSPVRLLSTGNLLRDLPGETISLDSQSCTLSGIKGDPERTPVQAYMCSVNNIPTSTCYRMEGIEEAGVALNTLTSVVSMENHNLDEKEKELLRWHYRLGHIGFKKVQFLMRTGILSFASSKRSLHQAAAKIKSPPKCAACQFGKQTANSVKKHGNQTIIKDAAPPPVTKQDALLPGQRVFIDHFVSSTKGVRLSSRGGQDMSNRYSGGCIFVDAATGYVWVEHQSHLNTHETLEAKLAFELACRDMGVIPQTYIADQGSAFTSKAYEEHLKVYRQIIKFAGSSAHHTNGVAERSIRTIMSIARTMMLHAAVHWGEMADATLWPMAVDHAVYLFNRVPDPTTGLSPQDLFTQQRWPHRRFHDMHVWGCPAYLLDKTIADGKKIPRWKPRSERCIYMGISKKHASTIPIVLNPRTRVFTTPYHVVFDDWFATVPSSVDDLPDFHTPEWRGMFGDTTYHLDDDDDAGTNETVEDQAMARREQVAEAMDQGLGIGGQSHDVATPDPPKERHFINISDYAQRERKDVSPTRTPKPYPPDVMAPKAAPTPIAPTTPAASKPPLTHIPTVEDGSDDEDVPVLSPSPYSPRLNPDLDNWSENSLEEPTVQQPTSAKVNKELKKIADYNAPPEAPNPIVEGPRIRKRPQRFEAEVNLVTLEEPLSLLSSESAWMDTPFDTPFYSPLVYKASKSDPDTMTLEQAMKDTEYVDEWKAAVIKEIRQLEDMGTWDEVPISEATGPIIPVHIVMKRKRRPDGTIDKHKGRLVVRGDRMRGSEFDDYETHAPVSAWSTIRMVLILSLAWGWHTCTCDYSNAFIHSDLPPGKPLFIQIPRGFKSTSKVPTCLKLKKSLYGTTFAPKLWSDTLFKALRKYGLHQCESDPCLFVKPGMMVCTFVDDLAISVKDPEETGRFLKAMQEDGFTLTMDDSLTSFLGIKFERGTDGSFTMTQPALIDKIIEATGMKDCNRNWTPAAPNKTLGKDPDGEPMTDSWNYRSVVGMLLYLSTNTRPDIAFAVSQVARFTHDAKQSHATAVKTLVRYLAGTRDQGTIFKPDGTLELNSMSDADFAGLFNYDPPQERDSAKSRMGYIITLAKCPLVWKSQLISSVCLATCESEYYSLSHCLRALIPIRRTLEELCKKLKLPKPLQATISSTAFGDNSAALTVATEQHLTSRTRYYHTAAHHFWQHVNDGTVAIKPIETSLMDADYMTKSMPRQGFEANRKRVQGW